MTSQANGTFEVKLNPQPSYVEGEGTKFGRMTIDKEYHGDLEATGKGEMLSVMTGVPGSAGYVAIEYVTGTLHGRGGSFALQHSASSTRGDYQLGITVVPDSGTGELGGLSGTMAIERPDGKHAYRFEYALPE